MLVRTRNTSNMRILRFILALYFLFLAGGAFFSALPTRPSDPRLPHIFALSLRLTFVALTVIFVLGAWIAWRERASQNFTWPMTASLVSLLIGFGIPAIVYFWGYRSNFWQSNRGFAIPAIMGVLGLIAFRRDRKPPRTVAT